LVSYCSVYHNGFHAKRLGKVFQKKTYHCEAEMSIYSVLMDAIYCENMATADAILNNKPINLKKMAAECTPDKGPSVGF